MVNSTYIGVSHLDMLRRKMSMVASNVANINTTSFKREMMLTNVYPRKTTFREHIDLVQDIATVRDLRQGEIFTTDNQLDVALNGQGYFAVQTDFGIRYTRNGSLKIDNTGRMTTNTGLPILNTQNQSLVIPEGVSDIQIYPNGNVVTRVSGQPDVEVGTIRIVDFDEPQYMNRIGDSLYETEEPPREGVDATLVQFALENSNANMVELMTEMIEVQRTYSRTKSFLDKEDERIRGMLQTLGRVA